MGEENFNFNKLRMEIGFRFDVEYDIVTAMIFLAREIHKDLSTRIAAIENRYDDEEASHDR